MADEFKASDIADYYMVYEATESLCLHMLAELDRYQAMGSVDTVRFGGNEIEQTVNFETCTVTLDFVGAEQSWGDAVLTMDIEEFRDLLRRCLAYYSSEGL